MKPDINYSRLRRLYPESISFDELCALLHFSKRKVKWMLEKDWIKHETREGKTWKYRIDTEAVIDYLVLSKKRPDLFEFPENCFSSKTPFSTVGTPRVIFNEPESIAATFRLMWNRFPDIISISEISELTGYSKDRIRRIMEKNSVDVLMYKQAVYFNKEAAILALAHPSSARPCDYTKAMQAVIFKKMPDPEEASDE